MATRRDGEIADRHALNRREFARLAVVRVVARKAHDGVALDVRKLQQSDPQPQRLGNDAVRGTRGDAFGMGTAD